MSRLRRKLGDPQVIETMAQVGYRIAAMIGRVSPAWSGSQADRAVPLHAAVRGPVPRLRSRAAGDHYLLVAQELPSSVSLPAASTPAVCPDPAAALLRRRT